MRTYFSMSFFIAGIAASEHRIVLADSGANCIHIFTEHGKSLACVGQDGTAPGNLHLPHGVTHDREGNIIVSECGNHRISIFTPGGKFVRCFGCKGSDPGMFDSPKHVCLNHLGQLVVADEGNQRLQLFNLSDLEKWLINDGYLHSTKNIEYGGEVNGQLIIYIIMSLLFMVNSILSVSLFCLST